MRSTSNKHLNNLTTGILLQPKRIQNIVIQKQLCPRVRKRQVPDAHSWDKKFCQLTTTKLIAPVNCPSQ